MSFSGSERATAGPSGGGASRAAPVDVAERALLDAHFVALVRGYEELHQREHPRYEDRARRRAVWAEIGAIVDQPAEDCRKRWIRMRKNYFRSVQRAKRQASGSESRPGHWPQRPAHEKLMTFLDTTFLTKERLNNILAKTLHPSDQEASEPKSVCSSDDDSSLPEDAAVADELQETFEDDEVVDFFVYLGESIKDFPEAVRIHVKREAFRIVTDAEEVLYHRKLREDMDTNKSEHIE